MFKWCCYLACPEEFSDSSSTTDVVSHTPLTIPAKIPPFDTNLFNSQQSHGHSLLHNFLPYATQQPLNQRQFDHQVFTEENPQNNQLQTQLKRKIPSSNAAVRSKKFSQQLENNSIPKLPSKIETPENQKCFPPTTLDCSERKSSDTNVSVAASCGGSSPDGKPECVLESKDLWEKFSELGTEMIITKTGR